MGTALTGIIAFAAILAACAGAQGPPDRPSDNIARGRPYTLSPAPNYPHCSDDRDGVQLTDGVYTEGYFWTQTGTVGWQSARPVLITVDLGEDRPIRGASFSTAAGVAGVTWPDTIEVFVSDDSERWYRAGDLVESGTRHGRPASEGYATHRYWTADLACHGRYLCFAAATSGPYLFCDEVEVYAGPETLLKAERAGEVFGDLRAAFLASAASVSVRKDIEADIESIAALLGEARLAARRRAELKDELEAARTELPGVRMKAGERAIVPYNPLHERVLRVRAAVWRAMRVKPCVWTTGRFDPHRSGTVRGPDAGSGAITLSMLRGEVRGATLNVTNPTDQALRLQISWRGARGGSRPPWLAVHEVLCTGVAGDRPAASALPEAQATAEGWQMTVPSGMTGQVWLSVDSATLPPGTTAGGLRLVSADRSLSRSVPVRVSVSKALMPERLSLSLGGWDYTQSPTYGVTERNVGVFTEFLRRYHVDAPWAQSHVMPFGTHDASGKMQTPPDTALMDRWLARWPGARFYFVFNAFDPPGPRTPEERQRVSEWISFWVAHLERRGVKASQLGLLILDEPREPEHDATIARYAAVIRQAQPDVRIFEDPIWPDPRQTTPELLKATDILCPNRPMWIGTRAAHEQVFLPPLRAGKSLAFYSCSGPVRKLDPYSYHRLQAWDAFRYGAIHMAYWAFGDTGGGSSWNEFAAPGVGFCPQFLGPDGCTTSKHMEAIREGLYDYETLTLLRVAADAAERERRAPEAVAGARKLLSEGVRRVTEAPGCESIWWADPKDRSLADAVRAQAIALLGRLTK